MHNCSDQVRGDAKRIDCSEVLDAFKRAVEAVPDRRDKDPILEPHYKLLSVVYKLVNKDSIDVGRTVRRRVIDADTASRWQLPANTSEPRPTLVKFRL